MGMSALRGGEALSVITDWGLLITVAGTISDTTARRCFSDSSKCLLTCRNSALFLSAANTVTQHDVSMARAMLVPWDEPSLHMMQVREVSNFIIGQDATTTGTPILNSANTPASANPMILCLSVLFICRIHSADSFVRFICPKQRIDFPLRSSHFCARRIYPNSVRISTAASQDWEKNLSIYSL